MASRGLFRRISPPINIVSKSLVFFVCYGFVFVFLSRICIQLLLLRASFISFKVIGGPKKSTRRKKDAHKRLSRKLMAAIASRKWEEVLVWITFNPEELLWLDKKKQSALHHACLFQAPVYVIELMILQAPELTYTANRDGEIPLHWAMRLECSDQILRLLLSASPSSGVLARDKDGNTPLSLLWERTRSSLLRSWWNGIDCLLSAPEWKSIMFLMTCNSTASVDHRDSVENQLLHTAAQCPCPPALFPLILRACRESLYKRDKNGRTPLAVACTDPIGNRYSDVQSKIEFLLAEDEIGSLVWTADRNGRVPFFISLASGIYWDEGLRALFSMQTSLLSRRDPMSGLYPFMLAAIGAEKRRKALRTTTWFEDDAGQDMQSLTTVYSLLRADPTQARGNRIYS